MDINFPRMHTVISRRREPNVDFGKAEGSGTISSASGNVSVINQQMRIAE